MFSQQLNLVGWLGFLLAFGGCTNSRTDFEMAKQDALTRSLTNVAMPQDGVPFYTAKTLDPVWVNPDNASIVKLPPFELTDHEGKPQTEALFNGRPTILTFFFTACPGFCPTLIKSLQRIEKRLNGFKAVQYVGISLDPGHDTPEALKDYFKRMKLTPSKWVLLTGDRDKIYQMAQETLSSEVFILPKSGKIAHSEHFFLFDPTRRLRGVIKGTRIDAVENTFQLVSGLTTQLAPSLTTMKAGFSPVD